MDVIVVKNPKKKKPRKILRGKKVIKKNVIKNIKETKDDILVTSAGEVKTIKSKGFIYDDGKSKMPATIFAIIVFLLGLYVINDQFYKDKSKYDDFTYDSDYKISKIDFSKDYLYLKNTKQIAYDSVNDIEYEESEIVFNVAISSLRNLEQQLNNEEKSYHDNYKYSSSKDYDVIKSNYNTEEQYLKSFTYNEYEIFESNNYLSLTVIKRDVSLLEETSINIKTYIISLKDGIVNSNSRILDDFNTSLDKVLENTDITGEYNLFVNSDCLGIIYKTDENTTGYNEYLTNICKK